MIRKYTRTGVKMANRFFVTAMAALLLLLGTAGVAAAQTGTSYVSGALSLANLAVSPQPVVAGNNITVQFQLYNSYGNPLNNVNIQLVSQSPIINVSPSYTFLVDSIGSGLFGGFGYSRFTYTLRIPASLPAGEYVVDVMATYESSAPSVSGTSSNNEPGSSLMPIYIYVYGNPGVSVTATPSPQITPGTQFTLMLNAENSGTDAARGANVTILNSSGLYVSGAGRVSFGTLAEGVPETASVSMYAATNISAGTHYIPLRITYTSPQGTAYVQNVSAPVEVLVPSPDVVASIAGSMPAQLYSGSNTTIQLMVQNVGGGIAKNVSIAVGSSPYITSGGAASTFFIGTLGPSASAVENVFVSANRTTSASGYVLPVNVTYQNADHSDTVSGIQYVPINVQRSALFNVTSVSGPIAPGASYVPVTFSIKNTGNEAAQDVYLSLQSIYPVTVINANNYITSLAPGQETNVTFYASADSNGNPGKYPVTLYEQWRQPNGSANQQYSGSNAYYISVGNGSSSGAGGITADAVYAVIVAVVAYVLYSRVLKPRLGSKKRKA